MVDGKSLRQYWFPCEFYKSPYEIGRPWSPATIQRGLECKDTLQSYQQRVVQIHYKSMILIYYHKQKTYNYF